VPQSAPSRTFIRRAKRLAGRLLLVIVPLLLVFLVCELILRATAPPEPETGSADRGFLACDRDSALGWIFPPHASGDFEDDRSPIIIETNTWGLRGPEFDPDLARRHVVVLGDSYAFGWGVEEAEAFPRKLEGLLRERLDDPDLVVINTGIPGYGPSQQLAMLRRLLGHVTPDIVIFTFSLANDPVDELRLARFAPDRLADYEPAVREADAFLSRLSRASRTVALVDGRTRWLQFFLANAGADARELAEVSVNRLIDACDEIGMPLLMVSVPQRKQILDGGLTGRIAAGLTRELRALPETIARRRGVPLLDLAPVLADVQSREDAYLPHDAHWTAAGHAAVARAVAEALPAAWTDRAADGGPATR